MPKRGIAALVGFGMVLRVWTLVLLVSSRSPSIPKTGTLPTQAMLPGIEPDKPPDPPAARIALHTTAPSPTVNALSSTGTPAPQPTQHTEIPSSEPRSLILPEQPVTNQIVVRFAPQTSQAERDAYIQFIGGSVTQNITGSNHRSMIDGLYYSRIRGRHSNGTWGPRSAIDSFVVDAP